MPTRPVHDRCPGVLRPFVADDGSIVRLRTPGGRISGSLLLTVARLAERFGAPFVHLTSRGNLQLRGLPDPLPDAFVDAVRELGLLPSAEHERARNIVAAPDPALDPIVAALDAAFLAADDLVDLPGRWLFLVTDRSGTFTDTPFDVAYQALDARDGLLHTGGRVRPCAAEDAAEAMLTAARRFLAVRPDAGTWNVRSLPEDSPYFHEIGARDPAPHIASTELSPGVTSSGTVVGVPLGFLDVRQAEVVAGLATDVVVTPERSLVLRDVRSLSAEELTDLRNAGLVLDPQSPTSAVTACIGAPSCRRTTTPTVALAREALAVTDTASPTARTHVVGCERACGTPRHAHLVVAPPDVETIRNAMGSHD